MDRQRAEHYLRTEAEAELRRPEPDLRRVTRIADILAVIGALDETMVSQIVDDFRFTHILRQGDVRALWRFQPRSTQRTHAFYPPAPVTLTVVPVGQVVEIRGLDAEMVVLSYAETASGALIAATGRAYGPSGSEALSFHVQPDIWRFTATDDRGASYGVGYLCSGNPAAILGLHTYPDGTLLHVYFSGLTARFGPQQRDVTPLLWILDSDGRWHVTVEVGGTTVTDGESLARMRVVPPLGPGIDWIEVHAVGQSADVRARLPLRWL